MTTLRKQLAKRIERVTFVRDVDDDADLSYLGEYSNRPGDDAKTVDRVENGDAARHEFRYFIAANSAEDTGNAASVEQDYKRAEAYNRGDWCMTVCYVQARVYINGVMQSIRSAGIGGVESDSESDYFDELKKEQLAELRVILDDMGFSKRSIRAALRDCEDEN